MFRSRRWPWSLVTGWLRAIIATHHPVDLVAEQIMVRIGKECSRDALDLGPVLFDEATSLLYFLGIDKAKFRRPVVPGDRLDLEVTVIQHRTNVWKLKGEASVDGTLCAQGELLASVVDRGG